MADYYSRKLEAHGATPAGVDWKDADSQELRFDKLLQIVGEQPFSINDLGCGYGALAQHLVDKGFRFEYSGWDVSASMIKTAHDRFAAFPAIRFEVGSHPVEPADYAVASGIFNVRLTFSLSEWAAYVERTIEVLDSCSTKGFAFNCLSTYSDVEKRREDLYYADPLHLFDLCKGRYSTKVALLHDYPLYEFTMLVRKN